MDLESHVMTHYKQILHIHSLMWIWFVKFIVFSSYIKYTKSNKSHSLGHMTLIDNENPFHCKICEITNLTRAADLLNLNGEIIAYLECSKNVNVDQGSCTFLVGYIKPKSSQKQFLHKLSRKDFDLIIKALLFCIKETQY